MVNVELTNKGKNSVQKVLSEINKRWYGILKHLTEEERENYIRILRRIVEVLAKDDE